MTIEVQKQPPLSEIEFYFGELDSSFSSDIEKFNEMYGLRDCSNDEDDEMATRLGIFKGLIQEEMKELDEIIEKLKATGDSVIGYDTNLEARTDIADLLGDLIVFCASEMRRFNLHTEDILAIIMASNFSKLGEDGQPIIRESDGKVMKGPNYWPPEPLIAEYLQAEAVAASNMLLMPDDEDDAS